MRDPAPAFQSRLADPLAKRTSAPAMSGQRSKTGPVVGVRCRLPDLVVGEADEAVIVRRAPGCSGGGNRGGETPPKNGVGYSRRGCEQLARELFKPPETTRSPELGNGQR